MTGEFSKELRASWDTWEIISRPFLDTDMPEFARAGKEELARRGITGTKLLAMRLFAAGGLCWNLFWWEWAHLGLGDILFGWALNFALLFAICVGFWFHWLAGFIVFVILVPIARLLVRFALSTHNRHGT